MFKKSIQMKLTDLKKNVIANYIGQFYSIFIGIFILPFYLKYLGAEAYGLVGFFTMLMSWMALFDMGLNATLQRETARLKDKSNQLIKLKQLIVSIETVYFSIAFISFIAIFIYASFIASHWLNIKELNIEIVTTSIKLMAIMLVFRFMIGLYSGIIMGFEEQVWLNKYKIFINTLKFIGAYLVIVYISNEIIYFFTYQLIIGIIEFIIIKIKINSFFNRSIKVKPSLSKLKQIAPFALSLAYTAGIWVFITQLDKLMLSHYLSLKEYGYFTLQAVVANAILQLFQPIGQAILPRMTSLLSNNKKEEMIALYHKSTQLVAIIILSVSGIVAVFSYELLYSWSGSIEASKWASPILFWYALGNGAVALLSFQYYMQYAHGNLKYHVKGNTYFGFFQIITIALSIHFYGAIGAGIAWFGLQIFFLSFWPGFIHNKFAPGIHKNWIFKDIMPILITSLIYLLILKYINIDFNYSRIFIFTKLILLGIGLLSLNIIVSEVGQKYIKQGLTKWKI
jgi:O-antigen/teichoic acid export membrane protein